MSTPKKSRERGVVTAAVYVDPEELFRVRIHLDDKEMNEAIDAVFEEGGAPTPGKALRWAGKALDEMLAGQMYDELTMDEEEILEMPPSAGGARTADEVIESLTGGKKRSEE